MTTNVPATNDDTPNYRDRNDALFAQRTALLDEIDQALAVGADEAGTAAAGLAKRTLRKARRDLDDNTAELVESNMGLVRAQVRRFTQTATADQRADYEAAGVTGLLQAINNFDPTKGIFSSWAHKRIKRNILNEVHHNEHQTIGQSDFERRPAILRARAALADAGERPTPEAIVAELERAEGLTVTLAQVTRVVDAVRVGALDAPLSEDGATVGDLVADRSVDVAAAALGSIRVPRRPTRTVAVGWPRLDERARTIVAARFGFDGDDIVDAGTLAAELDVTVAAVDATEATAVAEIGRALIGV